MLRGAAEAYSWKAVIHFSLWTPLTSLGVTDFLSCGWPIMGTNFSGWVQIFQKNSFRGNQFMGSKLNVIAHTEQQRPAEEALWFIAFKSPPCTIISNEKAMQIWLNCSWQVFQLAASSRSGRKSFPHHKHSRISLLWSKLPVVRSVKQCAQRMHSWTKGVFNALASISLASLSSTWRTSG